MSEEKNGAIHNVIMEKRSKLNMSGVSEVVSFDDETVVLKTDMGLLTIKGTKLNIGGFSATTTELNMTGSIYALVYTESEGAKGSFIKRLLK